MNRLILTRTLKDNERLIKCVISQCDDRRMCPDIGQFEARFRSHIIQAPMLSPQNIAFDEMAASQNVAQADAVILTSRNAVEALNKIAPKNIPLFLVGEATAQEVVQYGFTNIVHCAPNVADLTRYIEANRQDIRKICYLRGVYVSFDLEVWAHNLGVGYAGFEVYNSAAVIAFPPFFEQAMQDCEGGAVVFFSKRAAANFIMLAQKSGFMHRISTIKALCISNSVLESVEHDFKMRAYAAPCPDLASMARLILTHFEINDSL